jgi:hypothetical protein
MTTSNTGHGDVLTEDQWLDLAERHAHRDWNCRTPDGYLNSVKALCRDYAALSSASSGAGVLSDGLLDDLSREMVKCNRSVNWLCRKLESAILAATQRAEPVAQSGVEGLTDDELRTAARGLEEVHAELLHTTTAALPVGHLHAAAIQLDKLRDIAAALNAAPPAGGK